MNQDETSSYNFTGDIVDPLSLWTPLREFLPKATTTIVLVVTVILYFGFSPAYEKYIIWKNELVEYDLDVSQPDNELELRRKSQILGSAVEGGAATEYQLQSGDEVQFSVPPGFCAAVSEIEFSQDVPLAASTLQLSALDQSDNKLTLQNAIRGSDDQPKVGQNAKPQASFEPAGNEGHHLSEVRVPGEVEVIPMRFSPPDAFHYKYQITKGQIRLGTTLLQSPSDHLKMAEIDENTNITDQRSFEPTKFGCLKSLSFKAINSTPGVLRIHRMHIQNRPLEARERTKPTLMVRGSVKSSDKVGITGPVVVHLEPIGKDRKTKWHRTTQVASDGSFEFDNVEAFQYNVWASTRTDANALLTGSCPADVKRDKNGNQVKTWVTYRKPSPIARAKRTAADQCKDGVLILSDSPGKDSVHRQVTP